ncbi:DNA methyltransferase [Pedobacter sp. MR22-3]|uniref:DNA methyltransferase n=1 Tax=Pedobacter sp. MR22-3 TaxID=2994552 RepID=UPI0022461F02|nr:DNA methyltransferase [Pedobacter sp. MR22-3]MCX2584798.1 DNA methyltransferase [Pedobacter sp. MR22-3]
MIETLETITIKKSFDQQILTFLSQYKKNGEPIEVSFRELVPELTKIDRATHLIHTYPAKLLMHIPYFFLNNNIFSKEGDTILDPFSGSGTVMLEGILAGRNVIGADANPLARLISSVKVRRYDPEILKNFLDLIKKGYKLSGEGVIPKVGNINFWFTPRIQADMAKILVIIENIADENIRDFFLVCFSNCVKKLSLADQRVSVPVRLNPNRYLTSHPFYSETTKKLAGLEQISVFEKFEESVSNNINRVANLAPMISGKTTARIVSTDARNLVSPTSEPNHVFEESVSLIISSPPYAGAQKYIRSSSLNLGWLNLLKDENSLKTLDSYNIGRENYQKKDYCVLKYTNIPEADALLKKIFETNPLRAHIAGNYLREMQAAFKEAVKVLKKDGYFILIVANNKVCGQEFRTKEYLTVIMQKLGMKLELQLIDDIKSYGLMTKRNKTASVITREWVLVFKK